jgi:protease I
MKALILTAGGVEDSELLVPRYRLLEEGAEVDVAAPETGPVTGKHGYSVDANLTLDEVTAEGYDLLVLPGGTGPESVRQNRNAVSVARELFEDGKPVAAICHGPQILISADVLTGRTATSWFGIRDDLRAAGAKVVDDEVVVDGNLITSRQPSDLPAFCRELMKAAGA